MIDQLRQIAIFVKTIDHGSFRGAARELNLSPSVVSHQVSGLESTLGVTLIHRSTRELKLTPDGEKLLVTTKKMLAAIEDELIEISGSAREASGNIRVTIPSILAQSPFTHALASFSRKHPRINLSLDYSDVRRELIGEGFDMAIRMGLSPASSSTSRNLFSISRALIVSTDYLKAHGPINHPDQLVSLDWASMSPVRHRPLVFKKKKNEFKFKPEANVYSNDSRSLVEFVKSGVGVSVVPKFLAEPEIENGSIKILLQDWELDRIRVFAEWPNGVIKESLTRLLVDYLMNTTFEI